MGGIEYKVVKVPMKGIFSRDVSADLDNVLNAEGKDGWMLVNSVVPAGGLGESERVVLVFTRRTD